MHDLARDIPVCVDLDGTLIRSDLLVEAGLVLLRGNPLYAFALPFWLLGGKARLKREIARRIELPVAELPYDERLVTWLREDCAGRERVLCTASDEGLAGPVAAHLGLFDAVLASDGERNLAGAAKAAALVERYGERGFDYAGDEPRDLTVWRHARRAIVANGPAGLAARVAAIAEVEHEFAREAGGAAAWLRALRLHQWLKNLLVFLPLLAAHRVFDLPALLDAGLAFLAFGLCASGVYVLNDLFDLAADRRHPRKRLRPFAAGTLRLAHGLAIVPLLTLAAFALALGIAPMFAASLLGYYLLTLAYSLWLKRVEMLDVGALAVLYTLRIVAGGFATATPISFWMLAFSMFLFLSLALLKRYTELRGTPDGAARNGRGYTAADMPLLLALGSTAGYLAVLVLALYINSTASEALYRQPRLLWALCPILLFWTSRAWLLAHRGCMHDDPVVFAITDLPSLGLLVLAAGIVAGAV